jgi:folate-binding protein YgfZ
VVFSNPRFGLPGHDVWHPSGVVAQMGSPVPDELVEVLRIEHGLPRWGADMNTDTLPPEAGLDRNGISYTKGCYIGQETIARIKSIGHVNKHLVCLASPDATFAAPGTEIVAEGKPVGKVTSGVFSPALGKGLVLGYVPRALAQPGKNLEIAGTIYTIVPAPLTPTI